MAEEKSWAEDEVKALETMDVQAANKDGRWSIKGVSLKGLLEMAKLASEATALVFVADDGYSAEMPLADAVNCKNVLLLSMMRAASAWSCRIFRQNCRSRVS